MRRKIKHKIVAPIVPKDSWHRGAERLIVEAFSFIYSGIFDDLDQTKNNAAPSRSAIVEGLRNGSITYTGGHFRGKFNAKISKEIKDHGGKYDKRVKAWAVDLTKFPQTVVNAAIKNAEKIRRIEERMNKHLSQVSDKVTKLVKNFNLPSKAPGAFISEQFRKTITKEIGISPSMSDEDRARLNEQYTANIERSIKGFTESEVVKIREDIEKQIRQGLTREHLETYLRRRMKISRDRAKFIARQETALFTTEFKKVQYQNAGVEKYVWKTMGDGVVRPLHKKHNGKVFSWDDPPIISEDPERRGHPGFDFNCRCQASPIVDKIMVE